MEDEGFYTIDNMPALLMPRFAELCLSGSGGYDKVAMVSDVRGGKNFDELFCALDTMREMGIDCKLLFLEASVPAIIKRYKETRRSHPLAGGTAIPGAGDRPGAEVLLAPLRERAEYIIDTTDLVHRQAAGRAAADSSARAEPASGCMTGERQLLRLQARPAPRGGPGL